MWRSPPRMPAVAGAALAADAWSHRLLQLQDLLGERVDLGVLLVDFFAQPERCRCATPREPGPSRRAWKKPPGGRSTRTRKGRDMGEAWHLSRRLASARQLAFRLIRRSIFSCLSGRKNRGARAVGTTTRGRRRAQITRRFAAGYARSFEENAQGGSEPIEALPPAHRPVTPDSLGSGLARISRLCSGGTVC